MTSIHYPNKESKQVDHDLNQLDSESPRNLQSHAPNSITGWDDNKEPLLFSSCLSNKKLSISNSPQISRKPPVVPPLKPVIKQEQTTPSIKTNFSGWLNKRTRQNVDPLRKSFNASQTYNDYFSSSSLPQEPTPRTKTLTSTVLPLHQIKRLDEGSPLLPSYQPRGSVTSRKGRTVSNEFSLRRGDSVNNTPSPMMPIIKKTKNPRQQSAKGHLPTGSQTERGREEPIGVALHQASPGVLRKRLPIGCFKSSNSLGLSFSRMTFMGISRIMTSKDTIKVIKTDQIPPSVPREQAKREEVEKEVQFKSRAMTYKSIGEHNDIIIEEERMSVQTNASCQKPKIVRKQSEGVPVSLKNSTIQMPAYMTMTTNSGNFQAESADQALMERLKMKTKVKKYRPKAFLNSFRPKEKGKLPSNELNIQAFNNDNSTSLNL